MNTILLKQMNSKYFLWTLAIIINMLLLPSCLDSSEAREVEYSADAQIYTFSISSKSDTSNILNSTIFTIDQVNGKIFNKELLPYKFHIDSVTINLRGSSTYSSLNNVTLSVSGSEDVVWSQSDSVGINNLYRITTTAPDGKTTKKYDFQLNVHDKDPYILSWEKISDGYYITPNITDQTTVSYNNRFITYFIANEAMGAVSSSSNDGANWTTANISGLPPNVLLSSLNASEDALYILDETNRVFNSTDGFTWSMTDTDFPIIANYGILPSDNNGKSLVIIDDNNTYKFAQTDDFSDFSFMEIESNTNISEFPVRDFSSISINSSTSHAIKYIIIAGGLKADNTANNNIWIIQERNGKISDLKSKKMGVSSLTESTLFFYDNNTYLLTNSSGTNSLYYSDNFGLEWKSAGENQSLPTEMEFRKKASVITDNNNNIWIFGGVSGTQTQLDDVWRGKLNKFAQD